MEIICWAHWVSQIQSTGLSSIFLEHSLVVWPFSWKLWKHFLSNHCSEEPSLIIWFKSLVNTLQEHVLVTSHFLFFAEFAGAGFLSLFPDGLLFGNNHLLLQLTKVALNYSIFQWSRIKKLKLVKWKFNKVNCIELSSLGQSAVKLTSAGSHGNVVGCHSQDRWVLFRGFRGGCVGVEQLIAVILAISHCPTQPSMFLSHWVISVAGPWNRDSRLGGGDLPAMGADFIYRVAGQSGGHWIHQTHLPFSEAAG